MAATNHQTYTTLRTFLFNTKTEFSLLYPIKHPLSAIGGGILAALGALWDSAMYSLHLLLLVAPVILTMMSPITLIATFAALATTLSAFSLGIQALSLLCTIAFGATNLLSASNTLLLVGALFGGLLTYNLMSRLGTAWQVTNEYLKDSVTINNDLAMLEMLGGVNEQCEQAYQTCLGSPLPTYDMSSGGPPPPSFGAPPPPSFGGNTQPTLDTITDTQPSFGGNTQPTLNTITDTQPDPTVAEQAKQLQFFKQQQRQPDEDRVLEVEPQAFDPEFIAQQEATFAQFARS